jgi:DNA-binding response OmpR family regulator
MTPADARILVVEDDRSLRGVLRFALASGGWEVALAENGQHADDWLAKPFDVAELRARVRALLRRAGTDGSDALAFAELRLDRERHGVWVGPAFVDLSRTR